MIFLALYNQKQPSDNLLLKNHDALHLSKHILPGTFLMLSNICFCPCPWCADSFQIRHFISYKCKVFEVRCEPRGGVED